MSTFEIYVAIATGLKIFQLSTWTVLLTCLAGGISAVFIAAFFGQKIELFLERKFGRKKKQRSGLIYTLWDKYGIYGVGLIGTFFLGPIPAIGVGVGFNADLKRLVPFCLAAVIARCFIFTFLGDAIMSLL
jgi:hypothetical protein